MSDTARICGRFLQKAQKSRILLQKSSFFAFSSAAKPARVSTSASSCASCTGRHRTRWGYFRTTAPPPRPWGSAKSSGKAQAGKKTGAPCCTPYAGRQMASGVLRRAKSQRRHRLPLQKRLIGRAEQAAGQAAFSGLRQQGAQPQTHGITAVGLVVEHNRHVLPFAKFRRCLTARDGHPPGKHTGGSVQRILDHRPPRKGSHQFVATEPPPQPGSHDNAARTAIGGVQGPLRRHPRGGRALVKRAGPVCAPPPPAACASSVPKWRGNIPGRQFQGSRSRL